jgi:formylglycine-generating enzyme required for sulfatase activity
MVFVRGGCFQMGNVYGISDRNDNSVHRVCVDDFYMGMYEVTVGEFRKFVEATGYRTEAEQQDGCHSWVGEGEVKRKEFNWRKPNFPQSERHPVVCVSWNDAVEYIQWLNTQTGKRHRLPTEAEWEYAARSRGKHYRFAWGTGPPSDNIADVTAFRELLGVRGSDGYDDGYAFTSPVGSFRPNELGLYDLSGNVYEWVSDWYGKDYYRRSPRQNPQGPETGSIKIMRGGSWNPLPELVKTMSRRGNVPGARGSWIGFRLVHPHVPPGM